MLKTLGIVQACCLSDRFRANVARRLGGKSLLEWVVRRVTDCLRLDGVIVVARDEAEGGRTRHLVPSDVPVFVGSQPDALARFARALEEYPAEAVVRVQGDNPFVDPDLIDRLVIAAEAAPECDYVTYSGRDGRPAILSPVSIYAEWFRAKALRQAVRSARTTADREEVTRYLYSHPEKFRVRLIPAPALMDREDIRLRIDQEEDWDHALTIFEALGPEGLEWQRIAELLDHQPALRSRMAALNRVHAAG